MRLDHLLSKENVRYQITDVSYSKSTIRKFLIESFKQIVIIGFASIQSSGPDPEELTKWADSSAG